MSTWLATNWFSLIETAGIMASLLFTASALRADAKVRKTEVLLSLAQSHRSIWNSMSKDEKLARIMESKLDLTENPVTLRERRFVLSLILHLSTVHQAIREGAYRSSPSIEDDIREFLNLPIPFAVTRDALKYQSPEFQKFLLRFIGE